MSTEKILKLIQAAFSERLNEKNSWGKEEVKKLYMQVVLDVLMEDLL